MTKTFHGSCHCGAVHFEADLDLRQDTRRCNCRYCTKAGVWSLRVKPAAFRVTKGQEALTDYSRSPAAHHCACKHCGIRLYGYGHVPQMGGDYVNVNLITLDDCDLTGVSVLYLDGLHDTWATLAQQRYVDPFAG
jgi:hypothetical protein